MANDYTPSDLGTRLKRLRAAKGLSQREMAKHLGFGSVVSIISRIENGNRRLQAHEIKKWAELCGVSVDDILSEAPLTVEIGGAA